MCTLLRWSLLATFLAGLAVGQPALILKTRRIYPHAAEPVTEASRGHLLMQFSRPPTAAMIAELERRGITVLADVPENGLLVSLERRVTLRGLRARYVAPLDPADKISPLMETSEFVVEFHRDVDLNQARGLLLQANFVLIENPDLGLHHLMSRTDDPAGLLALAKLDEVSYIFPASGDLVHGYPTRACSGAMTINGPTTQAIPAYGDGWDGPGLGSAALSYVYSKLTAQLPAGSAQAEIQRAMAEWSKAVKITWTLGTNATGPRTVNILFATGSHGDGYPFDGHGGALAHTFYPSAPNPEPIAGDMHFDDSEGWRIGANLDLFSVALHELGHALGLGHADDPGSVMYPYYKMATGLAPQDIAAIQTLYASQTNAAPVPPTPGPIPTPVPVPKDNTPPTLIIRSPATTSVSTSSASMAFSGTANDNAGVSSVAWSTNTGSSGTALGTTQWSASIPVLIGTNTVTIRALDAAGNTAWRTVVVTRR